MTNRYFMMQDDFEDSYGAYGGDFEFGRKRPRSVSRIETHEQAETGRSIFSRPASPTAIPPATPTTPSPVLPPDFQQMIDSSIDRAFDRGLERILAHQEKHAGEHVHLSRELLAEMRAINGLEERRASIASDFFTSVLNSPPQKSTTTTDSETPPSQRRMSMHSVPPMLPLQMMPVHPTPMRSMANQAVYPPQYQPNQSYQANQAYPQVVYPNPAYQAYYPQAVFPAYQPDHQAYPQAYPTPQACSEFPVHKLADYEYGMCYSCGCSTDAHREGCSCTCHNQFDPFK